VANPTDEAMASVPARSLERKQELLDNLSLAAVWRAVEDGRAAVVEALLQSGADVNKVDTDGFAPLRARPSQRC
jgi:hypothetical protein